MNVNVLLFDGFESLDVFGPVEILGEIDAFSLHYLSLHGGEVQNRHGVKLLTEPAAHADPSGILVIPGGLGTRELVRDPQFLETLRTLATQADTCLSICTGAALLAACGVLDGKRATSNKMAMAWVKSTREQVCWVNRARWVVDGKFYTSSGVSAGMDMTLGFLCDRFGRAKAEDVARHIEYIWNDDPTADPFCSE